MISSTFFFLFSQLGVGMMLSLLFISPRSIVTPLARELGSAQGVFVETAALALAGSRKGD